MRTLLNVIWFLFGGLWLSLGYALAGVLVFIGAKIFVSDFMVGGGKFPPGLSLGVTVALIAGGVLYSLWKTRGAPEPIADIRIARRAHTE